jgi:flagellar hook-associated protein 2
MATTYVSGLMSGLDTSSIISQLMAVERQPLDLINGDISIAQQRKEVYQILNTDLLALKDAVNLLSSAGNFSVLKATSSNENLLTATVGEGGIAGTYSVTVVHSASRGLDASNVYASDTTPIGAGNIDISLGGVLQGTVALDGTDTLTTAAQKINAANLGVTAFVVNDGTGFRLAVQSKDTGAANDVSVVTDVPGLSFSTLSQARDAEVQIGDTSPITITSSTNTIEDVVPGVTFTVKGEPSTPTQVSITVETDLADITSKISDIISKYNEVQKTVSMYSTYDADTNKKGLLFGDMTIRMMMQDLTDIVTSTVSTVTGDYNSLMAAGVTIDSKGLLSLDETALENALNTAPNDITTLFTDSTEGIATLFSERLGFLTGFGSGVIYNQQSAFDEQITYLQNRAADMEKSLASKEEMYRQQFQRMEEALATLQSQGQFLSSQLGSGSGINALLSL